MDEFIKPLGDKGFRTTGGFMADMNRSYKGLSSSHGGLRWGRFTTRIPILHTRIEWPELWQGILVSGTTGLAFVPILERLYGLSFEQAIAFIFVQSILIGSAAIVFGEPFAPGWITPALPLVLSFLDQSATGPQQRMQLMAAMAIDFSLLLFILGLTGWGRKLFESIPAVLRGGILLGAALSAMQRILQVEHGRFLGSQPVTLLVSTGATLFFLYSMPLRSSKSGQGWLMPVIRMGLLPGLVMGGIVGALSGELRFSPEWKGWIQIPPFGEMLAHVSPFAIGFPPVQHFVEAFPLALISYAILFADLVTGQSLLESAKASRADDPVSVDLERSHYSIAIRNLAMSVLCPFFSTQGCLWTGAHVIILERWKRGREEMPSLFGGISSYYVLGIPVLYLCIPLITGVRPLMEATLFLTLALSAYVCASLAFKLPCSSTECGTLFLIGVGLAVFPPWIGLLAGLVLAGLLCGWKGHFETE